MHILETYFWYIKTAKISEKGILPMDSLKLHLNAVKIKNSFTMYKNIEINVERNSKYEMRPIQKKEFIPNWKCKWCRSSSHYKVS